MKIKKSDPPVTETEQKSNVPKSLRHQRITAEIEKDTKKVLRNLRTLLRDESKKD